MAFVHPNDARNNLPSTYRSNRPQQETSSWSRLFSFKRHEEVREVPEAPQTRAEKPAYNLQDYLPVPVEDRKLRKLVERIKEQLENHVAHFYVDDPAVAVDTYTQFEKPAMARHYSSEAISVSTSDGSVKPRINRVIATRLISGIQPFDDADEAGTLLPNEISRFLMSVPHPADVKNDHAFAEALGQWRVLSWYLLDHPEIRDENERIFQKRLEREIHALIAKLDRELQPYIDKSKDEGRREDLANLIRLVAELGRNISAQPYTYEFSWRYVPEDLEEPESESQEPRRQYRSRSRAVEGGKSKSRSYDYDGRVLFPALLKKISTLGQRTRRVCVCEPDLDKPPIKPIKRRTTDQAAPASKSTGI